MKLRQFEALLSRVEGFHKPDITLEQYMTPVRLAAMVTDLMDRSFDDVEDDIVCDLGCGTGMLSIACAYLNAPFIVAVDIHEEAIKQGQENARQGNLETIDFVRADIAQTEFLRRDLVHTVVMNPPFGTKRSGVDMAFLARAVRLAHSVVYSMHKTSTRDYIEAKTEEWGIEDAKVVARLTLNIGRTYRFQREEDKDVDVDLWRLDAANVSLDGIEMESVGNAVDERELRRRRAFPTSRRGRALPRARRSQPL